MKRKWKCRASLLSCSCAWKLSRGVATDAVALCGNGAVFGDEIKGTFYCRAA